MAWLVDRLIKVMVQKGRKITVYIMGLTHCVGGVSPPGGGTWFFHAVLARTALVGIFEFS
jgi:hypothetical protein